MSSAFDRSLARLLLEICRHTYRLGIEQSGPSKKSPETDPLLYIQNFHPLSKPIPIPGSSTSFACIVPFADRIVVSYMGTKTEVQLIELHSFAKVLKTGDLTEFKKNITTGTNSLFDSLKDWSRNIEASPVEFILNGSEIGQANGVTLAGEVHQGFLKELTAVQTQVVNELKRQTSADRTPRKVVVTGHSQGGAEAVLATEALRAAGFDVESTYTFAAPRAANDEYARSVTTPVHRIEFGDDIVPHMPPIVLRNMLSDFIKKHSSWLKAMFLLNDFEQALSRFENVSFTGVGSLCYGDAMLTNRTFRIGMSPRDEQQLFEHRQKQLRENPENWAAHHHLAGTDDDVKAHRPGNYTLLVSPDGWQLA